ncbi:calpain-9 isoform X2 [Amia ocellicauda]
MSRPGPRTHGGPSPLGGADPPRPDADLFVDANFPFSSAEHNPAIQWRRAKDICKFPKFILDGATRMDICQGKLSDCWFLSAVASLSLYRNLMEKVVPGGQEFLEGYTGRFCFRFWQYGQWQEVVVDDFLPTENGKLVYLHSADGQEFWSALLEKAYAKLKGGYQALQMGFPHEAMVDMTGGVTEVFAMATLPFDLAPFLSQLLRKGALINCANTQGPLEQANPEGIVYRHAYSVTSLEQVNTDRQLVTLVRVRNPWGHTEWTGPWSDSNGVEWSSVSTQEQKRIQRVQLDDGEFWMSLSDFRRSFDTVEVCHLSDATLSEGDGAGVALPWHCDLHEGRWCPGVSAGGAPNSQMQYWLNPQFRLTLLPKSDTKDATMTCNFLVALMQKNHRLRRVSLNIGLHIYQVQSELVYLSPHDLVKAFPVLGTPCYSDQREVVIRGCLAPGHYIIIPSTSLPNQEGEFILRVLTEEGGRVAPADKANTDLRNQLPSPSGSVLPSLKDAQQLFKKHSNTEGRCAAGELQRLLKEAVQGGVLARSEDEFCMERCKSFLALMDTKGFGKLEWVDFEPQWEKIRKWTDIFMAFDTNRSCSLEYAEIIPALQAAGLRLDDFVLQLVGLRFSDASMAFSFPAFLHLLLKLETMIAKFRSFDMLGNGTVTLNYRQWLHMTIYN